MHISTGIEVLDKMLDGGIEMGSSALIAAVPGVRDIQFAHQCFFTHLSTGGSGIYIVNNKKPAIAKVDLAEYDWDVSEFETEGRCRFIDCYSSMLSIGSKEDCIDSTDSRSLLKSIRNILEKNKGHSLILLDSASSLLDVTEQENEVVELLEDIVKIAKETNATLLALFTQWPYSQSITKRVEDTFECVIRLKAVESKVILRSYFSVERASWIDELKKQDIPYKVVNPGGVRVFIPKILVTGPYNAGKSSFVHSASKNAVSVDRLGTTVALDHGHVDLKGFSIDLFGTPGQSRFDPIIARLGGEALGVVVVVDATDPSGLERAKELLELTHTGGLPAVVVVNKSDLKGALTPESVKEKMALHDDIRVVPTVADNLDDVKEGKPCKLRDDDVKRVLTALMDVVI